MLKKIVCFVFLFGLWNAKSQHKISDTNLHYLKTVEDTLGALMDKVLDDENTAIRLRSDSMVTRVLVRALKVPYSFYYPFDSVPTITVRYPQDSTFRIFTWQCQLNEQLYRQKGAIQMQTENGSLQLYPLFDASEYALFPNDSIRLNNNWIGAIYYNIVQKEYHGKKVYTLLGYDENGLRSTKKWIDILTFNNSGQPEFGGEYFVFNPKEKDTTLWQQNWKRFNIEFKKEGHARLNYDIDKDMIIFDHLISESNEPEKKYSYIPDGDYEGLQWKEGKWVYISKVFNEQLTDGKEPRPDLLLNDNGEINEEKLAEQSDKNAGKKVEAKPIGKNKKKPVISAGNR